MYPPLSVPSCSFVLRFQLLLEAESAHTPWRILCCLNSLDWAAEALSQAPHEIRRPSEPHRHDLTRSMWYIALYVQHAKFKLLPAQRPPRSLLAEGLEADALDGLERLLAGGRDGLAEHELGDERPRRGQVPRRVHLRRDERVVVLQRRAEALRLERGPHDVLQDALRVAKQCVSASVHCLVKKCAAEKRGEEGGGREVREEFERERTEACWDHWGKRSA